MNPLLLHPLFLELRRRRGNFETLRLVCRPRGKGELEFSRELKEWLIPSSPFLNPHAGEDDKLVWMVEGGDGAFLTGQFTVADGTTGSFTLERPDRNCLGFELVGSDGREGLDPLPEGNGLTYVKLWNQGEE